MNMNNHRAYAYRPHETETCHNGRLGCWVEPESGMDRAITLGAYILEGVGFALIVFGLIALCAIA